MKPEPIDHRARISAPHREEVPVATGRVVDRDRYVSWLESSMGSEPRC